MVRSSNAVGVERNVSSTGGNQHSYTLYATRKVKQYTIDHPNNLPIVRVIKKYYSGHFQPAVSITECSRMVGRVVYC